MKKIVLPIFFNNVDEYEADEDLFEKLGLPKPEEDNDKELEIRDVAFYTIAAVLPQPHKGEIKALIVAGGWHVLSVLTYEEAIISIDKQLKNEN